MRRKEKKKLYERLDQIEQQMISLAITVTRVKAQINKRTDEPPMGTVLVDEEGIAYQRFPEGWCGGWNGARRTWEEMVGWNGTLTAIWTPGEIDD